MKLDESKFFLTGGAGFIGSHLVEALVKEGAKVKIFDDLSRNALIFTKMKDHPNVEFVQGDILNLPLLIEMSKGSTHFVHLAAIAGVSNYYNFPAKTVKTNLIGTYHVLEAVIKNKVPRFMDLSTSECFGPVALGVGEEDYLNVGPPQDRRWSYASSKLGGEQLTFRYSEEYGLNSTVVRPFNVYGPRQIGEGAISNFCKKVLKREKIQIEGDGTAVRSWCYIDDFIDVLMQLLKDPHSGVEAFNIGNPWTVATTVTLAETVVKMARAHCGIDLKDGIEFVPMKFTEIKTRYPSIQKIEKRYGWRPKVDLDEGVLRTLKWFLEEYKEERK